MTPGLGVILRRGGRVRLLVKQAGAHNDARHGSSCLGPRRSVAGAAQGDATPAAAAAVHAALSAPPHRRALLQDARDESPRLPKLLDLVEARDWVGARVIQELLLLGGGQEPAERPGTAEAWLAYCNFHQGDFAAALRGYEALAAAGAKSDPQTALGAAACHCYLGQHRTALEVAERGAASAFRTRLLLHAANALGDEERVLECRKLLSGGVEDQLSLAAIHFRRGHFQEATDIYKRFLLNDKSLVALNIYIALCYSRLDYYDVSQEILKV